jgi:hypothetical protein
MWDSTDGVCVTTDVTMNGGPVRVMGWLYTGVGGTNGDLLAIGLGSGSGAYNWWLEDLPGLSGPNGSDASGYVGSSSAYSVGSSSA